MHNKPSEIIVNIYENISDAVLILDLSGRVLFINNELVVMSGYTKDELLGKAHHILLDKESEKTFNKVFNSFIDGERTKYKKRLHNEKLLTKNKCLINVDVNVNIIEDGNKKFIVSIFHDISNHIALEERLIKEVDRMNEAKMLAKFGHWELNLVSNVLYWSDEVYDMFEVNKERFDPSYEMFLDKIHPDDRELVNQAYFNSVKNKTEYEIDHRILLNNEVFYYKEKGKTFYEGDTPLRSIGLVQDITEKVKKDIEISIKEEELLKTKTAIINALSSMTDMRDNETGRHIERTQSYIKLISTKLKKHNTYSFNDENIDMLVQVSPLHDIGKVGIPDRILLKSGRLTKKEFEVMKKHTIIGNDVIEKAKKTSGIKDSTYLDTAQRIIFNHHEKWDGTGYPRGLKENEIPIEGRIIALVDVYDALRSKRVYKEEFSHEKSKEIIIMESGKHFDPEIVNIFLEIEKEFKKISNELKD